MESKTQIQAVLCVDCESGFIIGFIIYTGADTDYEKYSLGILRNTQAGDLVAHFMRPYFYKGHVVYVYNWYSSPVLAEFLHDPNTGVCGTVKKTRKCMPKLNNKLDRGEIQVAYTSSWLAMKWMNKKEVFLIMTVYEIDYCATGKKPSDR